MSERDAVLIIVAIGLFATAFRVWLILWPRRKSACMACKYERGVCEAGNGRMHIMGAHHTCSRGP